MNLKNNYNNSKKVNLFLLGIKGYEVLKFIIESNYSSYIKMVVIGQDKNIDNDYSLEIENLCLTKNLNFKIRDNLEKKIPNVEFSIAISWKWLIKKNNSLIVLHDSLLPKYRGNLPLVTQLLNGEKEIGVTSFLANENIDEGDIIYSSKISIEYPITIFEAIKKIQICYLDCIKNIFYHLENNILFKQIPQNHKDATYSLWRDEEDYFIDWNWSINKISRFVDSVGFPYKGAKTILCSDEVTINKVKVLPDVNIENRISGKIFKLISGKPLVVCKDGLLLIEDAKKRYSKECIFPIKNLKLRFKNKSNY